MDILCEDLLDNITTLLDKLEIEYIEYPNRLSFPCPVHGGDNVEGACIFTDGSSNRGNWVCWTNGCERHFPKNLIGFIRGVMTQKTGKNFSFPKTLEFAQSICNKDYTAIETIEKSSLVDINRINEILLRDNQADVLKISRESILASLEIPSKYYIERGFKEETLLAFDVGDCTNKTKPMFGRAVVPVYNEGYNYIGCVGRSTIEGMEPKWMNSKNFRKSYYLYGYWLAREYIKQKRAAILVEGQGDVWRLYEAGIKNAVGIFGSNLSDDQLILLEKSGAFNIVILTDMDDAGKKAAEDIVKKCGRRFNYIRPEFDKKDIGDMSVEEVNEIIVPQIKGYI